MRSLLVVPEPRRCLPFVAGNPGFGARPFLIPVAGELVNVGELGPEMVNSLDSVYRHNNDVDFAAKCGQYSCTSVPYTNGSGLGGSRNGSDHP